MDINLIHFGAKGDGIQDDTINRKCVKVNN